MDLNIDKKTKKLILRIALVIWVLVLVYEAHNLGGLRACKNSGGVLISQGFRCLNTTDLPACKGPSGDIFQERNPFNLTSMNYGT